jgi:hypothetical protein
MEHLVIYTYKPHLTPAQKEELGREQKLRDKLAYDVRQWSQALEASLNGSLLPGFLVGFAKSLDESQAKLYEYIYRDLNEGFPE